MFEIREASPTQGSSMYIVIKLNFAITLSPSSGCYFILKNKVNKTAFLYP